MMVKDDQEHIKLECPNNRWTHLGMTRASPTAKAGPATTAAAAVAAAASIQGCESVGDEMSTTTFWIILFLAMYGAFAIMSEVYNFVKRIQKMFESVEGGSPKAEVQHVKSKENTADKMTKDQQVVKKISKKKLEKFFSNLTVEILKDISKRVHLPTSRLKKDLVQELITVVEDTKVD